MTTSILQAIGLLWDRPSVGSNVGALSLWKRDMLPIGSTEVQPGDLVELHVTIPPDLVLPDPNPPLRFDVFVSDFVFDDQLQSLRTPGADAPGGDFKLLERTLVERPYSITESSLESVVSGYKASRPTDFETSVLVVRDTRYGWKDIVAWWRVPVINERKPQTYFKAQLPDPNKKNNVPVTSKANLHIASVGAPGASVRLHGTIADSVFAAGEIPQPVPRARLKLGERTAVSTSNGGYVIEARLGIGDSQLTVERPGINTRTFTVRQSARAGGGTDKTILDETGVQSITATIAAGAEPSLATLQLNVTALVHRISGMVVWPDTRIVTIPLAAPLTLSGRRVCAVRLNGGPMRPKMPATSREWDAIRARPDVLRSARPGRPGRSEATAADGRFELSFVDLQRDAHYLIWVEAIDPRDADRQVADAIVRTIATPDMRRMAFDINGALAPERHDRRAVVSTELHRDGVGVQPALDVVKVIDTAPAGGPPALQLLRAHPSNLVGIDATPPVDVDPLPVDAATRRVANLKIEVLPLIPVFELPERLSAVPGASLELQTALDARYVRGHLLNDLRWVLDARRALTNWDAPATCALLERTLLTHPKLDAELMHDEHWGWWRADAVSAADFAFVDQQPDAEFANRRLALDYVPILTGPVPRLLGLFECRHLHLSPGHGVYAIPLRAGSTRPIAASGPVTAR